ncbi:hypothetical protein ACIRP0_36885 [Streptomyces sp. NPDC101733]|uniref:hypothetical protein n=1 Tax=Streptomyces sp. NPDC101733 TaxID=3366144 RepID=UPI003820EBE4
MQCREEGDVLAPVQVHGDFAAPGLAEVDGHRAHRGQEGTAGEVVEFGAADAEADGGLVGAIEDVAVQEGREVSAAGQGRDLVHVHKRGVHRTLQTQQDARRRQLADHAGGDRRA